MTSPAPTRQRMEKMARDWAQLFAQLHRDGVPSRQRLSELTTDDVRFHDPFNDLRGRDALQALFRHTIKHMHNPRFNVIDIAISDQTAYLQWHMMGQIKVIGDWEFTGMSALQFAADGRIRTHIDYWDSGTHFFDHLPLLGPIVRAVRARARVRAER